ncbi:hypothetical protein K7X08_035881 [Anisodus acutangulus]|uniref:Uncharacterized protein n=1 Tax=Anisodus acutangulus TaxID=402998 RepID=A0A9Q1QVQ6_9SOLA|nr:hypothetical protein K7X08_035881 [Anisodus acutangulus]
MGHSRSLCLPHGDEGIQGEPNASQTNPNETPAAETTPLQTPPTNTSPSQFSATNSSTSQTVAPETSPPQTAAGETADPVSSDHVEEGSDLTDSSFEFDHVAVFDDLDVDDESDVHEKVRTFRVERRAEREGFDETEPNNKGLEGRVGGDEPFYYSYEAYSCKTDEYDGQKGEIYSTTRNTPSVRYFILKMLCFEEEEFK